MTNFMDGLFGDYKLTIPASTILERGTVLGEITTTGVLAQFKSANTDGTEKPAFVLGQKVKNESVSAVTMSNVRVLETGRVAAEGLIFSETDTLNTVVTGKGSVRVILKANGIVVENGENVIEGV